MDFSILALSSPAVNRARRRGFFVLDLLIIRDKNHKLKNRENP